MTKPPIELPRSILADVQGDYYKESALLYRQQLDMLRAKRRNIACFACTGWGAFIWLLAVVLYRGLK